MTDVFLLADIFENFRAICMKNYKLDPAWYYSAPGLSWDALLKMTGVELELLLDRNMHLFFEKAIRGEISIASIRYVRANNKYMCELYDPESESTFIVYLDAKNLCGWAMSQKLPIGGFKWMKRKDLENWESYPCMLEVDLEYPKEINDSHNDYPLASESKKVNGVYKRKSVVSHTSRFAYKSIRIHRGRFADTTLVDSHTSKSIRLH